MREMPKQLVAKPLGWAMRKVNSAYDRHFDPDRAVISLEPEGKPRGRVLLAHFLDGHLTDAGRAEARAHNVFVEGRVLPDIFLRLGYGVDLISYLNPRFRPRRRYDLFLGDLTHFEKTAARLSPDCIRVVHLNFTHWLYNNAISLRRLQDVQLRRDVALPSYKDVVANRAIEAADCATLLGNEFAYDTYAFAGKRIFQVPNPMTVAHPWTGDKDFDACRNRFLWMGGFGFVQKGLDLVLEAFAQMPDMHLTVCGNIDSDVHFSRAFHRELHETPNIHTHGWVDIAGRDFAEIVRNSVALVYPTCSDVCCGTVVNCMAAGLVPLASREAGLDIPPGAGLQLRANSVEAVVASVRRIAGMPAGRLEAMAHEAWTGAHEAYSHARYEQVMAEVFGTILAEGRNGAMAPGFVPLSDPRRDGRQRAA